MDILWSVIVGVLNENKKYQLRSWYFIWSFGGGFSFFSSRRFGALDFTSRHRHHRRPRRRRIHRHWSSQNRHCCYWWNKLRTSLKY